MTLFSISENRHSQFFQFRYIKPLLSLINNICDLNCKKYVKTKELKFNFYFKVNFMSNSNIFFRIIIALINFVNKLLKNRYFLRKKIIINNFVRIDELCGKLSCLNYIILIENYAKVSCSGEYYELILFVHLYSNSAWT